MSIKKERENNFKFPVMNNKKIKLIYKTLSPAIPLEGLPRHLKHECISSLKIY